MNTLKPTPQKSQRQGSAAKVTAAGSSGEAGDPLPGNGETGSECVLGNVEIHFGEIQGNIFGGFLKDHQVNILLEVKANNLKEARKTLKKVNSRTGRTAILQTA